MLKWALAALAVCGLPASAAAADWRITGLNGAAGDRTLFLVDADSLEQPRPGEVRFDLLMLYQKPFQSVNRSFSRVDASCSRHSFTLLSVRFFSDERLIGETQPAERVDAPPGSAFESAIDAACTRQWASRTIGQPRAAADVIFSAEDPVAAARNM